MVIKFGSAIYRFAQVNTAQLGGIIVFFFHIKTIWVCSMSRVHAKNALLSKCLCHCAKINFNFVYMYRQQIWVIKVDFCADAKAFGW